MCGRYVRKSDKQKLAEAFHLGKLPPDFVLAPDYNAAPSTFQPVIRAEAETGEREMVQMRWGLIPFWAKDKKIGFTTINARAETVATSNTFREAFKHRHCIIPADMFYEWEKIDTKTKQAWAIGRKDTDPMAFAGLWETWTDPATTQPVDTFTIITTDPNEVMEPIHDRMPVILKKSDYDRWLAPSDPAQPPIDLLRPFDPDEIFAWKVSSAVGNVGNNGPELCQEWKEPDSSVVVLGRQQTLQF